MSTLPPLPPGFTLDSQQSAVPPLPAGFTLDQSAQPQGQREAAPTGSIDSRPIGDAESMIREPALVLGTSALATPAAGLAGLGATATKALGLTDADPADVVQRVQGALTYQPRTKAGQAGTEVVSYPFEKLAQGADWLGQKAADLTGSPAVGAAVNTGVQAVVPVGVGKGLKTVRVGADVSRTTPVDRPVVAGEAAQAKKSAAPAERSAGLAGVSDEAPTAEALKAASRAAYERARSTGAVIKPASFAKAKNDLAAMLQREGIDPTLHPSATAAFRRISQTDGPVPLDQIETLRRIAKDAEGALAPADRRLAAKIVESLDDYAESIDPRHLASGTPEAVGAFKEARSLWSRARKADSIAEMVDRATTKAGAHYTQAGMEHALRSEFKALALNQKKLRMFTKEEQAAIKDIARGGRWENSLRNLGKFDPSSGGMSAFMSTLLAGGGAIPTGGASLLLPVAGYAAKRQATKITSRKVADLDRMVRGGPINALARDPVEAPQNAFAPLMGEHIEMSGDKVRRWSAPIERR